MYRQEIDEKENERDSNGFTLVEVIVVVAIMSIVVLAVTFMMSTSSNAYRQTSKEIDLQQEAQTSMNQLEDMIISANKLLITSHNPGSDTEIKVLYYEALEESVIKHFFIIWLKEKRSLYFLVKDSAYIFNGTDAEIVTLANMITDESNLMAQYVDVFNVEPADASNQAVTIRADFKVREDDTRHYELTKQLKLRNKQ